MNEQAGERTGEWASGRGKRKKIFIGVKVDGEFSFYILFKREERRLRGRGRGREEGREEKRKEKG